VPKSDVEHRLLAAIKPHNILSSFLARAIDKGQKNRLSGAPNQRKEATMAKEKLNISSDKKFIKLWTTSKSRKAMSDRTGYSMATLAKRKKEIEVEYSIKLPRFARKATTKRSGRLKMNSASEAAAYLKKCLGA
jgi:hypothetical protein